MQKHLGAATFLLLAVALPVGACDDEPTNLPQGVTYAASTGFCSSFRSCDTCTPQNGCGWCYDSDGTGQCASGPDECATPAFEWTWNPDGCRVTAHASTAPTQDAADDAEPSVFGTGDASVSDGVAPSACLGPVMLVDANADGGEGGEAGPIPCVVEVP